MRKVPCEEQRSLPSRPWDSRAREHLRRSLGGPKPTSSRARGSLCCLASSVLPVDTRLRGSCSSEGSKKCLGHLFPLSSSSLQHEETLLDGPWPSSIFLRTSVDADRLQLLCSSVVRTPQHDARTRQKGPRTPRGMGTVTLEETHPAWGWFQQSGFQLVLERWRDWDTGSPKGG